MPISGAPASRATISATSRSRPKKNSASSTSNDAEPLERADDDVRPCRPRGARRARAPPAARRRCPPGRPRPRAAPRARTPHGRRRPPARCAASVARPVGRRAMDPLGHAAARRDQLRDRHLARPAPRRTSRATLRTPSASSGASVNVASARARCGARQSSAVATTSTGSVASPSASSSSAARTSASARSRSSSTRSVGRRAAPALASTARAASGAPAPEAYSTVAAVAMHLARPARPPAASCRCRARPRRSDEPAGAAVRAPPVLAQPLELRLAAHQRQCRVELRRQLSGAVARAARAPASWRRIASCSSPQLRPGLHADRVDQRRARLR